MDIEVNLLTTHYDAYLFAAIYVFQILGHDSLSCSTCSTSVLKYSMYSFVLFKLTMLLGLQIHLKM